MARIRCIKPEFPQSESMGRVSREARLCFILLWTLADDAGRLRGDSKMLASLLYPYDLDAPGLIDQWLDKLAKEGCIRRYALDSGHQYIEICNWLKHQRIDKPSASKLPSFADSPANIRESSRILAKPRRRKGREGNGRDRRIGIEGLGSKDRRIEGSKEGKGSETLENADAFSSFWATYPNPKNRGHAEKAWAKLDLSNGLFDKIMAGVRRCKDSEEWLREGGRYIPHPATWLKAKGWLDEVPSESREEL